MKCPNCGCESFDNSTFCLYCGADFGGTGTTGALSGDSRKLFRALCDLPFLMACVFVTLFTAASIVAGAFNAFAILATAGMWILFFSAQSSSKSLLKTGMSILSVTVKVQYIFTFVLCGVLALLGIGSLIVFICEADTFAAAGDFIGEGFAEKFVLIGVIKEGLYSISSLVGSSDGITCGVAVMIGFFIAAVVLLILNFAFIAAFDGYLSFVNSAVSRGKAVDLRCDAFKSSLLAGGIVAIVAAVISVLWLVFAFSIGALAFTLALVFLAATLMITRFGAAE